MSLTRKLSLVMGIHSWSSAFCEHCGLSPCPGPGLDSGLGCRCQILHASLRDFRFQAPPLFSLAPPPRCPSPLSQYQCHPFGVSSEKKPMTNFLVCVINISWSILTLQNYLFIWMLFVFVLSGNPRSQGSLSSVLCGAQSPVAHVCLASIRQPLGPYNQEQWEFGW